MQIPGTFGMQEHGPWVAMESVASLLPSSPRKLEKSAQSSRLVRGSPPSFPLSSSWVSHELWQCCVHVCVGVSMCVHGGVHSCEVCVHVCAVFTCVGVCPPVVCVCAWL